MISYKKEGWETGCRLADNRVGELVDDIITGKTDIVETMSKFGKLPYEYEESDFCKETTDKFFEHIVFNTEYQHDEVLNEYEKMREVYY